jgi:hypothetical protein
LQELKAVKDAVKKLGKKRKVGARSCMVHCLGDWHCSTQQASADCSRCHAKEEGDKLEEDTAQRHVAELAALDAGAAPTSPADGSDVGAEAIVAQSLYGLSVAEDDKAGGKKARSCRFCLVCWATVNMSVA